NEEPPRARDINPNVPQGLEELIDKAMAKAPEDRFSSAGDMAGVLRAMTQPSSVPLEVMSRDKPEAEHTAVLAQTPPRSLTARLPATGTGSVTAEHEDEPNVAHARGRRRLFLMVALALLIAVLPASRLIDFQPPAQGPRSVELPNLVGSSFETAESRARQLGLRVEKAEKPSDRPVGEVVDQDPDAGTLIQTNVVVTLAVSIGPREKVPDVRNLKLEEAEEILEKQGFQVKIEGTGDGDATVVSQSLEAGEEVPPGTEIVLTTEDKKRGKGRGGDD
ncbi:MAG: PASTA domain-containing protein, partial [Acidimicrobiia bacterium]